MKSAKSSMSPVQLGVAAEQAGERDVERRERLVLVVDAGVGLGRHHRRAGGGIEERRAGLLDRAVAVAAPVHRAVVVHAAQALGGHRALDRHVEAEDRREPRQQRRDHRRRDGVDHAQRGDRQRDAAGVAEVPGQVVVVAADVAGRAGGDAVARREVGVVQVLAADLHRLGLGVEHADLADLGAGAQVDDRDAVVEAGQHVGAIAVAIEHHAAGPAARQADLIVEVRRDRAGLEVGGAVRGQLARALGHDVEPAAVARHHRVLRLRHRPRALGGVALAGVVDVRVEVARRDRAGRGVEHGDPVVDDAAADRGEARRVALEAGVVVGLGVGHVDPAGARVDRHVEQHGADVIERGALGHRRVGGGVDREHVVIGQPHLHVGVEVGAVGVEPVAVDVLDDQAGRRLRDGQRAELDRRRARHDAAVDDAHRLGRHRGGLVAGVERRRVHRGAVGRHRQRARSVGEERQLGQPGAAGGGAEVVGVEHPDVGAADAGGLQVVRVGRVLAAVGAGDERPALAGAGEDDVARLVADQQRAHDARALAEAGAEPDDRHRVREVVGDPDLGAGADRDRRRIEADRHRAGVDEAVAVDAVDLQAVVRRVEREQRASVGRHRQRPHLQRLEQRERAAARGHRFDGGDLGGVVVERGLRLGARDQGSDESRRQEPAMRHVVPPERPPSQRTCRRKVVRIAVADAVARRRVPCAGVPAPA
jgi:hypothetical protein